MHLSWKGTTRVKNYNHRSIRIWAARMKILEISTSSNEKDRLHFTPLSLLYRFEDV